ncbi:MAG: hypothetical protein FJ033_08320 [Chloroflexi bacterium]|nr:hypothetical protein [Chloroflexota bacterium]
MARFASLSEDRIKELITRRGTTNINLEEYKGWIQQAADGGKWGEISLEASDNVRAIKRRTTIAGKSLGWTVRWHRKSTSRNLVFQVLTQGEVAARRRGQRRN